MTTQKISTAFLWSITFENPSINVEPESKGVSAEPTQVVAFPRCGAEVGMSTETE